jgi:hypothetical protein
MSYGEYREKRILKIEEVCRPKYDQLPDDLKTSVLKAWRWANNRLLRLEGEGWITYLYRNKDGAIDFNFSKPDWSGEHNGEYYSTGAEAILMSVLEYESGF